MKAKSITCFIVAVLFYSTAIANIFTDTIPSPEFTNQPYFFDKENNKLIPLEATSAKLKSKVKALGYGGFSSGFEIKGSNSTIVITTKDAAEFVLSGNTMMDPSQTTSLYKLKNNKNSREVVMTQHKGMFGKSDDKDNKINFNVKKDGNNYVFVVSEKLEAGEYAFINMMSRSADQSMKVYCFSVK